MEWARILGHVTGTVEREVLARIEYLAVQNRILRQNVKGRLKLTEPERSTLAKIGKKLGTVGPTESWLAQMARNATMQGWGFMAGTCENLLHDRNAKYSERFREILKQAGSSRSRCRRGVRTSPPYSVPSPDL